MPTICYSKSIENLKLEKNAQLLDALFIIYILTATFFCITKHDKRNIRKRLMLAVMIRKISRTISNQVLHTGTPTR